MFKKLLNEFQEFAVKGNVVDMAVGVIIGAAFGKIVTSLVNDIVNPVLGMLIGGLNFSEYQLVLKSAANGAQAIAIRYGEFLQIVLNFLIQAWAIFLLIKLINQLKRQKIEAPPVAKAAAEPSADIKLLSEIRDILATERNR